MLPRKLRITRAKPMKRNKVVANAGKRVAEEGRRGASGQGKGGYVKKLTPQEQSQMGRAAKLLGKNAAQMRRGGDARPPRRDGNVGDGKVNAMKTPESFVFEGHRAKSGAKTGLKMKKGSGKKAKPTKNSGKRAAAWKTKAQKAA